MRAIAHSAFGVLLLLSGSSALFPAEPVEALARLAEALSQNNATAALEVFDAKMPGYGALESNIEALVSQSDILCAIDVVEERDAGEGKDLDVDWYLRVKSQSVSGPVERRRERVTLHIKLVGGKWKITSLSSPKILQPLSVP